MALKHYEEALQRLVKNNPTLSEFKANGFTINNDTVALEAGRKRGSIKPSRHTMLGLITDIQVAEVNRKKNQKKPTEIEKKEKGKDELNTLKKRYQASLNREAMLVKQIRKLEDNIDKMSNVSQLTTNKN
jgi:hypothetical protein